MVLFAGLFNPSYGASNCQPCLAGYYCPQGSSNSSGFICPTGHYCPEGTQHGTQFKCPPGTFSNVTGLQKINQCKKCSPGLFCPTSGLVQPGGECDGGFFCELGSAIRQPKNASDGGGICPSGFYCPRGSSQPVPCILGHFCARSGLERPQGLCDAGWICTGMSQTSQPTDGNGGDLCPKGHFCQEGTTSPSPCPEGFFLPFMGASNVSSCQACLPGYFCNGTGLTEVSGPCNSGFYCPKQSILPNSHECLEGHYCPHTVGEPIQCPLGHYQPLKGKDHCSMCPAGFYCDSKDGPIINFASFPCPKGHYCPMGTGSFHEFKCPPGYFNNKIGLKSVDDCTDCLSGYICPSPGLQEGTVYECPAGYYCKRSANSSTPNDEPLSGICPKGHYCGKSTGTPNQCPRGTFSNLLGLTDISLCTPCPQGSFCNETASTRPTGLCEEGFYCPPGSIIPTQVECPAGNFCPKGSALPSKCPEGTFSNSTNNKNITDCKECLPGFYCPSDGAIEPEDLCWEGFYCPKGSVQPSLTCTRGFQCPKGSSIPKSCPAGFYTELSQQHACLLCPAGHYCLPINESDATIGGIGIFECPVGHYCKNGTGLDMTPCPKGTFSTKVRLSDSSECQKCVGGKYCGKEGLKHPSGNCNPGYYCEIGSDRPNPMSINCNISLIGDICWTGHMCKEGSDKPQVCPAGSYQNERGQSNCLPCPEGYFCPSQTSSLKGLECPAGYYCPENTTHLHQYPCPAGSYNPLTGSSSKTACLPCPGGKYCREASYTANGNISEGFFCVEGCKGPIYSPDDHVEECPIGSYCIEGESR